MDESNPVLVRLLRGEGLESIHRGAWVLADTAGIVRHAAGNPDQEVFARSATKGLQALPLVESGAAASFGLPDAALAVAMASHAGSAVPVGIVLSVLARLGLSEKALLCGPERPACSGTDARARRVANNCSGKHAGFLAVARHLGADLALYLDPDSDVQRLVRSVVAETCSVDEARLGTATDGCGAPTFCMPLASLATGIARFANASALPRPRRQASERLVGAATNHPGLFAGTDERICADLMEVTKGRLVAKVGAEGVHTVGVVGGDQGIAIKIDDGSPRGFALLLAEVLTRAGLIGLDERQALGSWASPVRRNWAGVKVGTAQVSPAALETLN